MDHPACHPLEVLPLHSGQTVLRFSEVLHRVFRANRRRRLASGQTKLLDAFLHVHSQRPPPSCGGTCHVPTPSSGSLWNTVHSYVHKLFCLFVTTQRRRPRIRHTSREPRSHQPAVKQSPARAFSAGTLRDIQSLTDGQQRCCHAASDLITLVVWQPREPSCESAFFTSSNLLCSSHPVPSVDLPRPSRVAGSRRSSCRT